MLLRQTAVCGSADQRIRIEGERIIYRVACKREHEIVLTPLELISRIAVLVLLPGQHRQVTSVAIPQLTSSEGDLTTQPSLADPTIGTYANSTGQLSRIGQWKLCLLGTTGVTLGASFHFK
jgi:hypothetical protein